MAQIAKNDPKPIGWDKDGAKEEKPAEKKKEGPAYEPKKTSGFVPSKDSLAAMSLEGSVEASQPAQTVNPKYSQVALDVEGERAAARPAWQAQVPKLPLDKLALDSKSVGRERQPKPEPVLPDEPPLEPAKRGAESI